MNFLFVVLASLIVFSGSVVSAQSLTAVGSYSDDARMARISELKTKYRINLTEEEKTRIASRCDTARNGLTRLGGKVSTSTEIRLSIYGDTISSLSSLRVLVSSNQIDASNLELLIVDYQKYKNDFDIATTAYMTAIDDVLSIDCKSEQENFVAGIEGVREGRMSSAAVANQIDDLTRSSLKTTLDTLKSRLAANGKLQNGD